jgi:hypothetical protein
MECYIQVQQVGVPRVRTFRSSDITRQSGDLLAAADHEPVQITRNRKPRYVLMRKEHYQQLTKGAVQSSYRTSEMSDEHLALLEDESVG